MPELISINRLATLTGIDRRTVTSRLAGLDYTTKGKAHLYDSAGALRALYVADAIDLDDIKTQLDIERTRKEKSIADKNEMALAIQRRDFVPRKAMERIGGEAGEVLKSTLLGVGPSHAPALTVMTDPGEVADYLDREMRNLLDDLINKLSRL